MKQLLVIFTVCCSMILSSCNSGDVCTQKKFVAVKLGLYNILKKKLTGADSIVGYTADSITIRGIKDETKLPYLDIPPKTTEFYLPLHKFDTVSTFIVTIQSSYIKKEADPKRKDSIFNVTYKSSKTDTITITHSNADNYLSLECGCIKVFNITSVKSTGHFIDSTQVKIPSVNNQITENITLYTDSTHIKGQAIKSNAPTNYIYR